MSLEDKLFDILNDLTKAKVKRVKARRALEDLLTDSVSDVVTLLNNSPEISWKRLVFTVIEFNVKEIDGYLQKQQVDFSNIKPLLDTVLTLQFKNDNYSGIKQTIQHIADQLTRNNEIILSYIGLDYIHIISSLIDNHSIRCILTQDRWYVLINCVCSLIANKDNSRNLCTEASQVLVQLIDFGSQHTILPTYFIFDMLRVALCEFKDIYFGTFFKLLKIFNMLTEHDGISCRDMVCKLGNDILKSVPNYLNNSKLGSNTEQFLKFVILQVNFHHPSDFIETDYVTKEWIDSLQNLHQFLLEKLQLQKHVFQDISDLELGDNEFANIPGLFYSMLVHVIRSNHLIQDYLSNSPDLVFTSQTKRIRICRQNFVELIVDNISNCSHSKLRTYLHLLNCLLENLPHIFKKNILTVIPLLFDNSIPKTGESAHHITDEITQCLISIVKCRSIFPEQDVLDAILTNIQIHNLRFQRQSLFYKLLSLILIAKKEAKLPIFIWKDIQHLPIDPNCIEFLFRYLSIRGLPSCHDISSLTPQLEHSLPRHSTRIFFINLLLPEKIDNIRSVVTWLTNCDHFFILGQLLASQCMRSCKKSLLFTDKFFSDSILRKSQYTTKEKTFPQDSSDIMLEFEFIPPLTATPPEPLGLYSTVSSAIPSYNAEYVQYIERSFSSIFNYFTINEDIKRSTVLLSLLKYYFYFHFNLVIWSSQQTDIPSLRFQNELISFVFNQFAQDLTQFPSPDTFFALSKLEDLLAELYILSSNSNCFYTSAIHSIISSLLDIIPGNLITILKSIISKVYTNPITQLPIPNKLNPFDTSLLDKTHNVTLSVVRILYILHSLCDRISSPEPHDVISFLTNTFFSKKLDKITSIQCVFTLQATFSISEHFASNSSIYPYLILDRLLQTCSELCKFNQTSLKRIMDILQSLAKPLISLVQENSTISHHVENLLRILTAIYFNLKFSSTNRKRYIEFIFYIYDIFSELHWLTITLQSLNDQNNVNMTLEEIIYGLDIDFKRDNISQIATLLSRIQNTTGGTKSDSHFTSFYNMISNILGYDQASYMTNKLIPNEYADSITADHLRSVLVFLVKMSVSCVRKSSFLVCQVLYLSLTRLKGSLLINKVLSNISTGLSYPDLFTYFDSNFESIFIEWRQLKESLSDFPYELIELNRVNFIEKYLTKSLHVILLTSDDEAMSCLINSFSHLNSDLQLLEYCFEHIICVILMNSPFQLPILGLNGVNNIFHIAEARNYLLQKLSLIMRRELFQNNVEACLRSIFTKYIGYCSEQRKQYIESISPPCIVIDLNIESMEKVFSLRNSLITFFQDDPFLLPRLHIFMLKNLYTSIQPHTFVFNLYSYCSFLQFIAHNANNSDGILYFLMSDPVYVLLELLTTRDNKNTDLYTIKSKFGSYITNEDTCTLIQTLYLIYEYSLTRIPDFVQHTISIFMDTLCFHSKSSVNEISDLCLCYVMELIVNVLFKFFKSTVVAILIYVPSDEIFEGINDRFRKNLKSINSFEILKQLAMNSWYMHMSCLSYLNQTKLYLHLSIQQGNITNELNSILDLLIQKIHLVASESSSPYNLSELLCEIFILLAPYYSRRKLAFESKNLDVYMKPINLSIRLCHLPILLSKLTQLVSSTDIQLKEIAYNTYYSISDPQSLRNVLTKLSGQDLDLPLTYSSHLLSGKTGPIFIPSDVENTFSEIPLQIPLENSVIQTRIWVRKLCLYLLDNYINNSTLLPTKPLIEISDECAEDFLKMYIYEIMQERNRKKILTISRHINNGLRQAFDLILNTNTSTIPVENRVNEFSTKILLEIVKFLKRMVLFNKQCKSFRDNFLLDLDINYLYLACSAFLCKDYHSTLLYLHTYTDPLVQINSSHHSVPNDNLVMSKLLINTYGVLGEVECVNSVPCDSLYLEFQKAKLVGKWPEVIQMCTNFPFNQIGNSRDLSEAMHEMGWYSMVLQHVDSFNEGTVSNLHYESAWRLCLWEENIPDIQTVISDDKFSQQIIYDCVLAFKEKDIAYVRDCVCSNASHNLTEFFNCTEGSIFNISNLLSNIVITHTLVQISTFAELVLASHRQSKPFPFQPLESPFRENLKDILGIRVSLLLRLINFLELEDCQDASYYITLFTLILNDVISSAKLARRSHKCTEANNLLYTLELKLQSMTILPNDFNLEIMTQISLASAKIKLLQKDFQTCFSVLKQNMNRLSDHPNNFPELQSYLFTLYGQFLSETQQETSSNVSNYFEKSVIIVQNIDFDSCSPSQVKLLEKAYYSLAQYSDKQYSVIVEYLNSSDYKMKLELAEAFDKMSQLSVNLSRPIKFAKAGANEYRQQSSEFEIDKINFLKKALGSYCSCLELSDTHDMSISRVINLWFDNSDNLEVNQIMPGHLHTISSHKFIPWAFQIIPRLCLIPNDVVTPFSKNLTDLVLKMTNDHPYHCLPILLSILLSPLDACFLKDTYGYGSLDIPSIKCRLIRKNTSVLRCKVILDQVQTELVLTMENAFADLIEFAYFNSVGKAPPNLCVKFPRGCAIQNESLINNLPVLSIDIPISPSSNYSDVVKMVKFESKYILPGGNTRPKLLTCLGSDGNNYKMLLKGREDLRKDAVIQQGFSLINQLLSQNSWFVEKGVTIRTYKIVPLSQGSGLISFCEGTISIADYLINSDGAHYRYYPKPTSDECAKLMTECGKNSLKVYRWICNEFHPVFRFFFFENFTDSTTWYERKMQYTRSVAVSSMAGYIFGVGDRHVDNIRIDTSTAEIVHIDFGELFDSGKNLKVPELVPFRLTRDMVDPMGELGKEGVFRPCCEETLKIIRMSKENIKSILKVLLHTPLHEWKILQNCLKASMEKKNQSKESSQKLSTNIPILRGDSNEIAVRVLIRINEKIDGIEGRTPLSIAGQVNRLIAEATDEVNLSLMYPGWKPWL